MNFKVLAELLREATDEWLEAKHRPLAEDYKCSCGREFATQRGRSVHTSKAA